MKAQNRNLSRYFTWYSSLNISNVSKINGKEKMKHNALNSMFSLESIACFFMVASTFFTLSRVPSWQNFLLEPCQLASILCGITVSFLFITRQLGAKALIIEPLVIMLFLAGMPLVYISSCLLNDIWDLWLCIELLGFVIYLFLAIQGLKKSPWFLVIGVAAHGLIWDSWHYSTSSYIPDWYAIGCLIVDVGMSLYIAARISTWRILEKTLTGTRFVLTQ